MSTLVFNGNIPTGTQTIASTTIPINTNFASLNSAFCAPVGGSTGGGNFCTYSFQATTTNFTLQPVNPIGVLYTTASTSGNPELAYINNVNSVAGFTGSQLTGGGITAAAWAVFDANGNVAASYNVSSVSVTSPGNVYTVNFTRAFAAGANYAAIPAFDISGTGGGTNVAGLDQQGRNTSSYVYRVRNAAGTFVRPSNTYVVFFGYLT